MSNKVEETAAAYGSLETTDVAALSRVVEAFRPSLGALLGIVRQYAAAHAPTLGDLPALQAELVQRASASEADILARAGAFLSSEDFARRLGISRQSVNERKKARTVLSVSLSGRRGDLFPEFQLDGGSVKPWVSHLLERIESGWDVLSFLTARRHSLGGESHLDRIRRGLPGAVDALKADADAAVR